MRAFQNTWVIVSLVGLAACAGDPETIAEEEVAAVGDDLSAELLDVLDGVDAEDEGATLGARESLLSRLAELQERYEAAIAAASETGSTSEALRDPSAPRDLVVIGDSLSDPRGNPDGGQGWVTMLEANHADQNIANLAVGGTTAMDWAGRRPELRAALDAELLRQPDTVVVFLGGNDVLTYEPGYDDGIADAHSLGNAIQGLLEIITRIRVASPRSRIVLGTYYDLFDLKSALIPASMTLLGVPGTKFRATSWNTIALNLVIHAIGAITSADVVDNYGDFMNHAYGNIWLNQGNSPYFIPTFDVHPNTAGHQTVYRNFRDHLGY